MALGPYASFVLTSYLLAAAVVANIKATTCSRPTCPLAMLRLPMSRLRVAPRPVALSQSKEKARAKSTKAKLRPSQVPN